MIIDPIEPQEPVRNHRNKLVVAAARLHRARARRESGETLIEGRKLLSDALDAGIAVKTVFALPGEQTTRGAVLVDDRALKRLAGTDNPVGPVAVIQIPDQQALGTGDVLISHGVSDPGNVGTMIRTAASFGWSFGYTEETADPWSPKVLRAGAGGQFQTPIVRLAALPNMPLVATVVTGGGRLSDVTDEQVAVLIGEEASGLPSTVIDSATYMVTIPTTGPTESLNAAVASGIVVYELSRRRRNGAGQV